MSPKSLRFSLLTLFGFAGRSLRRYGWLVAAALAAWIAIDTPLYQGLGARTDMVAFVIRRGIAASAMALVMAAIIDGGQRRRPEGVGFLLSGWLKAFPTILLAESALWAPLLILQAVFRISVDELKPMVAAVFVAGQLVLLLTAAFVVPAAVDGGRTPWAAARANLALLKGRRWLVVALSLLMVPAMIAAGAAVSGTINLLNIRWSGPMLAFYAAVCMGAVLQGAAYLEFRRLADGGEPERMASAFD